MGSKVKVTVRQQQKLLNSMACEPKFIEKVPHSGQELIRFLRSQVHRDQGHGKIAVEILWACCLLNHWRNLNQNLFKCFPYSGHELFCFQGHGCEGGNQKRLTGEGIPIDGSPLSTIHFVTPLKLVVALIFNEEKANAGLLRRFAVIEDFFKKFLKDWNKLPENFQRNFPTHDPPYLQLHYRISRLPLIKSILLQLLQWH